MSFLGNLANWLMADRDEAQSSAATAATYAEYAERAESGHRPPSQWNIETRCKDNFGEEIVARDTVCSDDLAWVAAQARAQDERNGGRNTTSVTEYVRAWTYKDDHYEPGLVVDAVCRTLDDYESELFD